MPLNATPKAKSNPNGAQAPQAPAPRPQVNYNKPTPSSARAEALKSKLKNQPPPQPAPPRRAGSSARAEEYAKLQKFGTPQGMPVPETLAPQAARPAPTERAQQPLSEIEPPPSGLRQPTQGVPSVPATQSAQTELSQVDNSVEAESSPTEANSEPLSPQFVALAKQERAIRRARQEFKAEQDAWKQEKANFISRDEIKSNPLKILADLGISNDHLVELQLNQASPDPNQALHDKIAELESKLSGVNEEFTKRDTASYNAAVNQIRRDVEMLVDSDERFETIKAESEFDKKSGTEAVVELIKRVFDAEGTILPVEEAAQMVEEKLLEREFSRVQRLSKLTKIQKRLSPPAEPQAEASQAQQPQTTTLTNSSSVQRPLSARERAVLAFERAKSGE